MTRTTETLSHPEALDRQIAAVERVQGTARLLRMNEVALLAQLSERQVMRLIAAEAMPPPVMRGHRTLRFNLDQIAQWLRGEWKPNRRAGRPRGT